MAASNLPRHQVSRRDDAGRSFAFASYLRVAAMSGVVLIHTLSGIVGNPAIRFSATWWAGTALDLGSSWAVPVFIMVSGALLLESRPGEGARAFYARRLQRIAIPLVVAHVGYLLVRFRWLHEPLTMPRVVADLLHATVYVQLYFFWIILGLYLSLRGYHSFDGEISFDMDVNGKCLEARLVNGIAFIKKGVAGKNETVLRQIPFVADERNPQEKCPILAKRHKVDFRGELPASRPATRSGST